MKKSVSVLLATLLCISTVVAFPILNLPSNVVGSLTDYFFGPEQSQVGKSRVKDNKPKLPETAIVLNNTYHNLSSENFLQNWSNPALITTADNWNGVPSILGYLGDGLSSVVGTDPQTVLGPGTTVDVVPQSSTGASAGGVHEIEAFETIAIQGSGTANAPHIVLHLNTSGRKSITVTYTLVETELATVDQKFAIQYRVGESGNFTNIPNSATSNGAVSGIFNPSGSQSINVSSLLPSAAENQPQVQVRVITNDASGSDAMIGVDDIVVTSSPIVPPVAYCSVASNVPITDDGYDGTLGSMVTKTIPVTATGNVTSIRVSKLAMTHNWAGDVTMKLRSPDGTLLTLLNRPGVALADDGTNSDGLNFGDNSKLATAFPITFDDSASTDAELMGNTIDFNSTICQNDGICSFNPGPDTATTPPSALSDFIGLPANGTWTLYAGDSALDDVGELNEVCLEIATPSAPEMDVKGGSPFVSIADEDSSPSLTDHTDFGSVNAVGAVTVTRQFFIDNLGTGDLNIPGTPKVIIGGTNAADFILITDATTPVEPTGSVPFEIRFDPSTAGLKTATVSIASNDTDENPYNFSIQGTGVDSSLQFSSATYSAAENVGSGNIVMQVTRTGSTDGEVSATVSFSGGTATGGPFPTPGCAIGVDYNNNSQVITFTNGDNTAKNVFVPICNEADIEPDETFNATLGSPTGGAVIGTQSSATNTITDDDAPPPAPEINVQGNGVDIVSGDTTPDPADHTAFGSIAVGGGSLSRTFTIQNLGTAALNLTNNPRITISGPHPGNFGLTTDATTPVAAGGSTTFTLSCTPSGLFDFFAIVVIQNDDPTGSEGSSGGYNFTVKCTGINGRYRSAATGNWNELATWEQSNDGGTNWVAATSTPTSTNSDSIVIRNGHTVTNTTNLTIDQTTIDAGGAVIAASGSFNVTGNSAPDLTNNGTLTVNVGVQLNNEATIQNNSTININGIVQINSGGSLNGATYVYGPNSVLSFNSAFTVGSADDGFWPSTNGPANVSVVGFGNVTLNVPRTVTGTVTLFSGLTNAGNLTVNGMLDIWTGGFVTGSPTYGPASTLRYFSGGTYGRAGEWLPNATSGAGYPNNVTIVGNTTLDLPNSSTAQPFQMAGDLLVETGSKLQMAGATPMTASLTVLGDVSNSGEIELSTQANGDLFVGGNWTNTGTLTHNTRTVNFNGAGAQSIGGNTDFGHLVIQTTTTRTITFAANSVQAAFNSLTFTGTAGNLLTLRSSTPGVKWGLSAPLTQNVSFVDVQDSDADFGQTVNATNSVNSGNNDNWNFGVPAAPVMTTSPGSLLFGNVNVGATSAAQQFTVTNSGTASLTFSAALGGTDSASFILAVDNSTPIGTGANRQGTVQCAPTSTGAKSATLTISGNDPANPSDVITLSCTGVAPEMSIENDDNEVIEDGDTTPTITDETDFGTADVNSGTVVRTFTIENLGSANLNLTGTPKVVISGTHASEFVVTAEPASPIVPAGSTTFQVTFDPAAAGLRSASISIANDDADENPYNFDIQGTGTVPGVPVMTTSPSSLNLGDVAITTTSSAQSVTISNTTGTSTLNYTLSITGADASNFAIVGLASGTVAAGGSVQRDITFSPNVVGAHSANLSVSGDDPANPSDTISLSGNGIGSPVVLTDAATLVTGTSAQLNGQGNPRGASTTGWFRYSTTNPGTCNDVFGTRAPSTGGDDLGSGTSGVAYNEPVTGLTAGTTYYFCAIAQNIVGTSFGAVEQFTTQSLTPVVTTNAATSITASTATLNGTANPNGFATTAWFRYSTSNPGTCNDVFGTRAPGTGGDDLGSGTSGVGYDESITVLSPSTTYFYCAIAANSHGTSFGAVLQFTTDAGGAPTVTTNAASLVTTTTATLNGSGNPNQISTTGWFRYSTSSPGVCNDSFGTRVPSVGGDDLGSGNAPVAYDEPLTGLSPATTYFYCAIAQNSVGVSLGSLLSFTTAGAVPTVTTNAATGVTATTATLNGSANPNQVDATGWFRYSTTNPGTCNDSFGTRAPNSGGDSLGSGNSAVPFSEDLTGLSPETTYFFCAIAQNAVGVSFGSVLSFTTIAEGGAAIVVDSLNDNTTVDGQCTLREAIIAANTNTGGDCAAGTGDDTITFVAGLFNNLSAAPEGTLQAIVLNGTELLITSNMTIVGPGADKLSITGNNASRVFAISAGTQVNISGLAVTGGNVAGSGGGINNLGDLTLTAVSINGNTATSGGGIMHTGDELIISRSTIAGNSALGTGTGGGIHTTGTSLTLMNSTVSGNSSGGPELGFNAGGIFVNGTIAMLTSCTVTNNSATVTGGAGGIDVALSGTVLLRNSIVAANVDNQIVPDLHGAGISSGGYNLIGDPGKTGPFDQPGDQVGDQSTPLNPQLNPLADNGGATLTHRPDSGFPGHDKGCSFGLATDQRGYQRTVDWPNIENGTCTGSETLGVAGLSTDIGAVELLIPTAAHAVVSGRVLGANGRGLSNIYVSILDMEGKLVRLGRTNTFGYFVIYDVPTGADYVIAVYSKRYSFANAVRILSVEDNVEGVIFVANPQ